MVCQRKIGQITPFYQERVLWQFRIANEEQHTHLNLVLVWLQFYVMPVWVRYANTVIQQNTHPDTQPQ